MRRIVYIACLLMVMCNAGSTQLSDLRFEYIDLQQLNLESSLFAICEDSQGRIWFGSSGGGIGIYDGYSVHYLTHNTVNDSSLISNLVLNIYRDQLDRMWVGTFHGFTVFDANGNWLRNGMPKPNNRKDYANYCESFLVTADEQIWIGTQGGLFKYEYKTEKWEEFHCPKAQGLHPELNDDFYIRLAQSPHDEHELWLGSNNGLKSFNRVSTQFKRIENTSLYAPELLPGFTFAVFDLNVGENGILSIAGFPSSGYLLYDPDNGEWKQYLVDKDRDPELVNNFNINTVLPVSDSILLFGSSSKFGAVDLEEGILIEIPEFRAEIIGSIREMILSESGIVWLVAEKGMARSKLPIVANRTISRKPYVKSLKINGLEYQIEGLSFLEEKVHDCEFEFVTNNPIDPKEVEYRWKLDGIDREWKRSSGQNLVRYTNLHGGKYELSYEVRASKGDWIRGEPLSFEVKKRLRELALFYPTIVLLLGALVFFVFWLSNHRKRKILEMKLSYERKLVEAELNALRSHMNPHFIFNSLNSIYNYIHNDETEYAAEYLSKFSKLMRMILQNSREKLIQLSDEIQVLKLYLELEQVRFDEKFTWKFEVDQDLDSDSIYVPPMLIQPYIEDSIWHGIMHKKGAAEITISFSKQGPQRLLIRILDTGVGRRKSKSHKIYPERESFGMKITKKRIDSFEVIYGQPVEVEIEDLYDNNTNPLGTLVNIDLPLLTQNQEA